MNTKNKAILVISVFAAFSLFAISGVQASPGDIEVNGTGWWWAGDPSTFNASDTPIQHAINNASSSDTIFVHDGTYNENIVVDKSLTLKAASSPIIDGKGMFGPAVNIQENNVIFKGFIIKNFKANETYGIGAILVEGDNAKIDHNIICDITPEGDPIANPAGIGIDVHANNVTITSNAVHDVGSIGIRVRHDWNTPPTVSNNILVENNTVYRTNNTGVLVTGYAKGVTIKNNKIYESLEPTPYNLFVHYGASDVVIENNNIHDPYNSIYGHNIVLAGCDDITITDNNIANTTIAKNIYLLNDYNNWTGDNTTLSTNVTITNNNIKNGKWGVRLKYTVGSGDSAPMATTTTINLNNIVGNTEYGVENTIGTDVDAEWNWWGAASGPNATTNPTGTGDNVSDYVDFVPWLTAPVPHGKVPTYATATNIQPKVIYKWEKPDDYNEGDGYTHVQPIPGKNVTVDKYVVVYDENGRDDIKNVTVRTFYPLNGAACNCTACNKTNCCDPGVPEACNESLLKEMSIAEKLSDRDACDAAVIDAYEESLLTIGQMNYTKDLLDSGNAWIYVEHNNFTCCDPSGYYTVCAQVFDYAGNYSCKKNTFWYMSITALRIDFSKINYGVITPNVKTWVDGDDDMTTPDKPTIKNDGNDPMDIVIDAWNMTSNAGGVDIPANKLDANISGITRWFALQPGNVTFNANVAGCTNTSIDFSIQPPVGIKGDYCGFIRLTGKH